MQVLTAGHSADSSPKEKIAPDFNHYELLSSETLLAVLLH